MGVQNNRWIQSLQANHFIVCIQLGRMWHASLHQALKQKPLITMIQESVASNNFLQRERLSLCRRRQYHFPLPLFVADGTRRGFTLLKTNYSKSNVTLLVVNGASCSPWLQIQNFTQSWFTSWVCDLTSFVHVSLNLWSSAPKKKFTFLSYWP